LKSARSFSRQAIACVKHDENQTALYETKAALREALFGNWATASQWSDAALSIASKPEPLQKVYLPAIRTLLALNSGNYSEVVVEPRPITAGKSSTDDLIIAYVRGEVDLAAGRSREAAGESQAILDCRNTVESTPISTLVHRQLGRAYALQGHKDKARLEYEKFFNLWKDADPDIPILKQAKAEYAKLQ
jgi:eukaryotic-like serine/threonine-protein kinase